MKKCCYWLSGLFLLISYAAIASSADCPNTLMKNKAQKLAVEGHADARGSHEYNLALGQSRAEAVQKYLVELGVDRERLNSLSYGEEKPAKEGAGEEAWSKNRRAEFTLLASK